MKQRIITGVVAAALFIPIVIYGGVPFTVLVYALASIGLYELIRMNKLTLISVPTVLAAVLLWIILIPSSASELFTWIGLGKLEITFVIVLLLLSYTVLSKNTFTFDNASFLLMATTYVAMGFLYLNETRILGIKYVFCALFVIWATDSGAYFVGKALGKRKLWPEISPNKTIEGSLGGIVCGIIVALVYNMFFPVESNVVILIVLTIIISIFGQIGDLVQSAFKRHYGVKDSGTILPGHGGILDRTDSWLFVLPISLLLITIQLINERGVGVMKNISLLGASGSIGTQTLDVLRSHPDQFRLVAFSVGKNIDYAVKVIQEFSPQIVSVQREEDVLKLQAVSGNTKIVYGSEGTLEVALHPDAEIVVNAVVGSVGLLPTLRAIGA